MPPRKRLEAFRAHLEKLVQEIEAKHCKVILATHCNRFGTKLDCDENFYIYAWVVYYPSATPTGMLKMEILANNIIKDIAKKYHIPAVDLASVVSDHPKNFADFSHFTDKGSALVARLLTDTVIKFDPPKKKL